MKKYLNPEMYAADYNMSLDQAITRCAAFATLYELIRKESECKHCWEEESLVFEAGNIDDGSKSRIYCKYEYCDFETYVVDKYPHLSVDCTVDSILALKSYSTNDILCQKELGMNWKDFVEKENTELLQRVHLFLCPKCEKTLHLADEPNYGANVHRCVNCNDSYLHEEMSDKTPRLTRFCTDCDYWEFECVCYLRVEDDC